MKSATERVHPDTDQRQPNRNNTQVASEFDFKVKLCYHMLSCASARCCITSKIRGPCYDYWSSLTQKHHFGISGAGCCQRSRLRRG